MKDEFESGWHLLNREQHRGRLRVWCCTAHRGTAKSFVWQDSMLLVTVTGGDRKEAKGWLGRPNVNVNLDGPKAGGGVRRLMFYRDPSNGPWAAKHNCHGRSTLEKTYGVVNLIQKMNLFLKVLCSVSVCNGTLKKPRAGMPKPIHIHWSHHNSAIPM